MKRKVRISEQIPAGESTGVDVPGQLWKRYHMEKTLIAEDVDANVEMGMSHTEDTAQGLFTYFAGGLIRNIPHKQQGDFVRRENSLRENTSFAGLKQKILRIW